MTTVNLYNLAPISIDGSISVVATNAPTSNNGDPTTSAYYYPNLSLGGNGFTYNASGHLIGGTVTSISLIYDPNGLSPGADEDASAVSIPVATLTQYIAENLSIVPLLFDASNTIVADTSDAYSTNGTNVFNVIGAGVYPYEYQFPNTPSASETVITIGGTIGLDTANFSSTRGSNDLRSDAVLNGGGGNEMLYLYSPTPSASVVLTATMTSVDTLQFVDGSVYENNAVPGAQAALMFEGIFGRLPDAVNAGGFALIANQSGQAAAAAQMLATPEGNNDTVGLTTGQFVSRLYVNMLHRQLDPQGAAGWVQNIDTGQLSRAMVTALFAVTMEAQEVNAPAFDTGFVFAADPNAVEVLRAYELLLNREPEAGSLAGNTRALDNGSETLQRLYSFIQSAPEFASDSPNRYGIMSNSPFATVYAAAHSDPFNSMITSLVTNTGVAHSA